MADDPSPPVSGFEFIEHTADVGVRAWGPQREDVFAQAALGMLSLVVEATSVEPRERYEVCVEASDGELLLAAWLNELLYFVEGRHVVFSGAFQIEVREAGEGEAEGESERSRTHEGTREGERGREGAPLSLRALAAGEPQDPSRHDLRSVVKAATLHRLSLHEIAGGWEGYVLLDV
jgi:SHS2 domain-containing protein